MRLPRLASFTLFGGLPALLMALLVRQPGLGWDFHAFYFGAREYLSGESPYPGDSLAALADKQGFVYPAPIAALFVPFALLPYTVALALWLVGSIVAIGAALRILGVRDWRCFGALLLTHPAQQSVRLGTLMPVLTLLLALLWRYRGHTMIAALLCAVVALSKLFLFPLIIWLALTRRLQAALWACVFAAGSCLLGWLPIHLATIASYPSLLHDLATYEQTFSYSLTSFGVALGLSASTATLIAVTTGLVLICCAVTAGRSDDFLSFKLTLAASFVLSPIVWGHYFVLLAVPLALSWPRLSPVWLAAIWIKSDTLQMRDTPVLIGLALLVLLVQLDLVGSARGWIERIRPRERQALGVAFVAALLLATAAAAEAGKTRDVTLRASPGGRASGAGSVRIDRSRRELCWRLWTEALPPQAALIEIRRAGEAAGVLTATTEIRRDGQSSGCVRLNGSDRAVASGLANRPSQYRLSVLVPAAGSIAGSFRRQ